MGEAASLLDSAMWHNNKSSPRRRLEMVTIVPLRLMMAA
jgi:hypothetical protein